MLFAANVGGVQNINISFINKHKSYENTYFLWELGF